MISRVQGTSLAALSLLALAAIAWPFLPVGFDQLSAQWISLGAIAVLLLISASLLDGALRGPKQIALLAVLAAVGAGVRVATGGTGGLELVFLSVILGGRAFGPRFGFLLGIATIAVSSLFFGGFGPWTGYQMFATAWMGAGAGLLARGQTKFEPVLLAGYGVVSSYLFGLVMNLWFWPVATTSASLSYRAGAPIVENLLSFLSFSLISSTLSWDTVRAISVGLALLVFTAPALRALRRAKL